jgi:hypothetical protein
VWASLRADGASLVIAARKVPGLDGTLASDLHAIVPGTRISALCWALPSSPPFSALRVMLLPGACLALVIEHPRTVLSRMFSRRPRNEAMVESVCSSLLLHGFLEPACSPCSDGALLLHARAPVRSHWLDAFFEQPAAVPGR